MPPIPPLNLNSSSSSKSNQDGNDYSFGSGWTVNIDEGTNSGFKMQGGASGVPSWVWIGAAAALVVLYLVKK